MTEPRFPTLSNPRGEAIIEDWPIGRQRCRARFTVERDPKRGQRVARETENKARTGWNAPKRSTYSTSAAIVDGFDGKTYFLTWSAEYGMITLHEGTMKYSTSINESDPHWDEWLALVVLDRKAVTS